MKQNNNLKAWLDWFKQPTTIRGGVFIVLVFIFLFLIWGKVIELKMTRVIGGAILASILLGEFTRKVYRYFAREPIGRSREVFTSFKREREVDEAVEKLRDKEALIFAIIWLIIFILLILF